MAKSTREVTTIHWEKEEIALMLKMTGEGKSFKETADKLNEVYKSFRSPSACRNKLTKIKAEERRKQRAKAEAGKTVKPTTLDNTPGEK